MAQEHLFEAGFPLARRLLQRKGFVDSFSSTSTPLYRLRPPHSRGGAIGREQALFCGPEACLCGACSPSGRGKPSVAEWRLDFVDLSVPVGLQCFCWR